MIRYASGFTKKASNLIFLVLVFSSQVVKAAFYFVPNWSYMLDLSGKESGNLSHETLEILSSRIKSKYLKLVRCSCTP